MLRSPQSPVALASLENSVSPGAISFDTIGQTVICLEEPWFNELTQPTMLAPSVAAMQRLVMLLCSLRSNSKQFSQEPTPESLAPYVSEEAYDLLDALQAEETESRTQCETSDKTLNPALIEIESLIPYLLWGVARSSYSAMQMIEGVRGQCFDRAWTTGMVRLVVMLQVEAPTVRWCVDLATRCAVGSLLATEAQIRSDAPLLPVADEATQRVDRQLQALSQQIEAATSALKPLLDGVTVDLLQPNQNWQRGTLQLKLGLEFMPYEDSNPQTASHLTPATPAAPPFDGSSLIRLREPGVHAFHMTASHHLVSAVSHLRSQNVTDPQLHLDLVQAAWNVLDGFQSRDLNFLQPQLLMDEFMPQLLWQVTRSGYDVMQLVGGVEAQVLQPALPWEQGSLRLAATLTVVSGTRLCRYDLSTGQCLTTDAVPLPLDAIVQSSAIALCRQPVRLSVLSAYLKQVIQVTTPEINQLASGIAIESLNETHEWQSGTLRLCLDLTFAV
ncbi:hypothetical protein H6F43_14605 [Leptolyngbya sp. FACHB-36]|uniref:hypothetical protein n=1 Tax=Leptolyngbya sp. FACHB-36 TaxID=2692808 RepID=UPI0019BD14C6|nr:hypothetical protein [Leptolyngbya sp. FACHB-36]MBD2021407.1 hypothetical protein [Leptolyngbya sp. FACHB-36]